jgi:hypothetical protein
MVSANANALGDEFEDIVEERDVTGAASIAVSAAGGGAIAQQLSGVILPKVGLSARPSTASGLFASGLLKMLIAAGSGVLAGRVGGTPGLVLALFGVGALVVGGGDWINAGLASTGAPGGNTQGMIQRMTSGNSGGRTAAQSAQANVRRVQPSSNTGGSASGTSQSGGSGYASL